MGRPLNKKYFGNRNIGVGGNQVGGNNSNNQNYADDRIGGEGVASYGTYIAGSGWTTQPTASISAPNIPGGVTATGTFHYKALSFATTANGSGYDVGNVLEVDTGTATTKARAPVASIVTVSAVKSAGGSDYNDGDELTFSGAGWSQNLVLRVNRPGGGSGTPDDFTILQNGIRTAAAPANPVAYTSRTGTGNGCTVNIGWGVYSFGAVSVAGDYTVFPSTGGAGTLTSVSPATGTGAKADITMGLLSVTNITRGSGYTVPADAALVFSPAATPTNASATAVLTTDSGAVGSATNQENAIVIYANTSAGGTTALVGDIIRQVSGRRYKVKTTDGIKICKLGIDDTPAPFGAYIVATAASGGTYYVTKLTAHKATLSAKTGNDDLDGLAVQWTFGAPSGSIVKIENA
jgi:hypothetical protein